MKTIKIFCLLIGVAIIGACTQPDGRIGDWFGSWHLEEMLIDGVEDPDYNGDIMVDFQGSIFHFAYIEKGEIYGKWSYAGEILTLIGGYNNGGELERPDLFNPFPTAMYFPADVTQLEITVNYINNKTMQWQYIDQNDRLITYNFRKYP